MNPPVDELRSGLELACQPQNASLIVVGRSRVLELPREWVLDHIEQVAMAALDLSDDWEYRRLLELAEMLDPGLLQRFVSLGLGNPDPDVHEVAEDFKRDLFG